MPDSPRPQPDDGGEASDRGLRLRGLALAALAALAMGAAARGPANTTDRTGERIFFSRDETPVRIACADCHLVTAPGMAPPDDLIRPGHSLFDAFGRGNWWNGQVTTDCGEAGERCLKRFMGGDQMPGRTRTSLVMYMKSLGAPVSNPLVIRRMPPGQVEVGAGDPQVGRDLFRRACGMCHPGGGAGLGPDLRSSEMTLHQIADLIRTGSDPMPFYQLDILSNQEVAHIAAATYALRPEPE